MLGVAVGLRSGVDIGGGQIEKGGGVGELQERFAGAVSGKGSLPAREARGAETLVEFDLGELARDFAVGLALIGGEDLLELGDGDGFSGEGGREVSEEEERREKESTHGWRSR